MMWFSAVYFLCVSLASSSVQEMAAAQRYAIAMTYFLCGVTLQNYPGLRKLWCIGLSGMLVWMTVASGGGIVPSMWGLLFPLVATAACRGVIELVLGGLVGLFFAGFYYLPVLCDMRQELPDDFRYFYPIIYATVYACVAVSVYLRKKKLREDALEKQRLEKAVKAERERVMAAMTQTILSISNAVDARDNYTRRHSFRVAEYSLMLARELGWDENRREQLYRIALLHDIGKIGISDAILNKHSSLTEEEWEAIRQHTVIGGAILKDLTLLPNASIGAISHHERYDGKGYPFGLRGEQIPLEARIIGIADAFDAMNSSRIYRARVSSETILRELREGRGKQFDPMLLDYFLPIAEKVLRSEGK